MAKINKKEYHILKSLDKKWQWVVRDLKGNHGGNLFVHSDEPYKRFDVKEWNWDYGLGIIHIDNHLFQFVQWEDEEPHYIPDLIDEYEFEQEILARRESISKGKPTIPRYVANLLEEYKSQEPEITFYGFIKSATNIGFTDNQSKEGKFTRWLTNKNENVVMKAWLAYPNIEVEEEQKYYVLSKDKRTILLTRWTDEATPCAEPITEKEERDQLTEQEIKDYDPRYWPFAVKVEELEE